MSQYIEFNVDGEHYTLGYTRNTIRQMEQSGFNINELNAKPMTLIPRLWAGAFLMNHKREKQERINHIWNRMDRKDELVEKLTDMYLDAMSTIIEEEETDSPKIEW